MDAGTIGTIIVACVALIGLIGGGIAWFYKRGGQERESSIALRDNTAAITELSGNMKVFMERTIAKQELTDTRVNEHDRQISLQGRDISELQRIVIKP